MKVNNVYAEEIAKWDGVKATKPFSVLWDDPESGADLKVVYRTPRIAGTIMCLVGIAAISVASYCGGRCFADANHDVLIGFCILFVFGIGMTVGGLRTGWTRMEYEFKRGICTVRYALAGILRREWSFAYNDTTIFFGYMPPMSAALATVPEYGFSDGEGNVLFRTKQAMKVKNFDYFGLVVSGYLARNEDEEKSRRAIASIRLERNLRDKSASKKMWILVGIVIAISATMSIINIRGKPTENERLAVNAEDIVRRWCRSPDAFVKDETLSIPMLCGPIPDDVKSACRILASKNPDVLLAAYSVLILRDYEYRFRDFGQYPPTHIDPSIPWEVARWTLSRLGLLLELRRAEDEGVEIGISPYVDGILGKCEEIFKDDLYGMELVARVKVLRDKLNYRYMCQGLDTFRESIPSVDDVREYRFWEGKDFSFRSVRTNDVCRGSFVCLHKVEKSVGDKVLQLLASARGNGGWRHSYGDDKPFHFRELDCVLQNGDTVTIKVRINDGLSSGFIICSARQCWGRLLCPPQEIWRELSEIFLKVSREASGSAKGAKKGK